MKIANGCNMNPTDCTNRISRVYTTDMLTQSLFDVARMVAGHYNLLIVDGVSLLYDNEYDLEQQRCLHYANMLLELATKFGIAAVVVVSNSTLCMGSSTIVEFKSQHNNSHECTVCNGSTTTTVNCPVSETGFVESCNRNLLVPRITELTKNSLKVRV